MRRTLGRPGWSQQWTFLLVIASLTLSSVHVAWSQEPYRMLSKTAHWKFSTDGTGIAEVRVLIKVNTAGGVQQLGQLIEPYVAGYEDLQVDSLTVQHEDGTQAQVRRDQIRDLPAPVTARFPMYSDLHLLHTTVPELRAGDTIDYRLRQEIVLPFAPGNFWLEYAFKRAIAIDNETLVVDVPNSIHLKLRTADDLESRVEEKASRRIYTWTHSQPQPEKKDNEQPTDIHALLPRPDVELTSFKSWQALGDWYDRLAESAATPSRRIREKAQELTANAADGLEKVRALYNFVRHDFRYLGLEFGVGRYQPHAADDVLKNGYGDCKDKHTLFVALLRATGIEAHPVLINAVRAPSPSVPTPGQFNHVITEVHLDGKTLWLDTTQQVNPFGYLIASIRGKQGLLVRAKGRSELVTLPDHLPFPSFEHIHLVGTVDESGELEGTMTVSERGDAEYLLRLGLLNSTGQQREQLGKTFASAVNSNFTPKGIEFSDPADTDKPLEVTLRVAQTDFLPPLSPRQSVELPGSPVTLPEKDEATESMSLGEPAEYSFTVDLSFPEGARIETPVPIHMRQPFAELDSGFKMEGSHLLGHRTVRIFKDKISETSRDAYAELRNAVRNDGDQKLAVELPSSMVASATESSDADALYEAGKRAERSEDYENAIKLFQRAVDLKPNHSDAWEELGRSLVKRKRYEEAIVALRKQIEVTPYHATARNNLGWALEQNDDYRDAIRAYRDELTHDPVNRYATERLGRLLWFTGAYADAVPYLKRAIRNDPDDMSLVWRVADAELHNGDPAAAKTDLQDFARSASHEEISDAMLTLSSPGHDHGTALEPLQKRLMAEAPDDPETWMLKGWQDLDSRNPQEAVKSFSKALTLDPKAPGAQRGLAASYFRLRDFAKSSLHYGIYLKATPNDSEARIWYARALLSQQRTADAEAQLSRAVRELPDRVDAWLDLSGARMVVGDRDGAIKAANQAAALEPTDLQTQLQLVHTLNWVGEHQKATSIARKLSAEPPGDAGACGSVAEMLFNLDDYNSARTMAKRCLEMDAAQPLANDVMGVLLARSGAYSKALPYMERAAKAFHGSYPNQEMLDYVRHQVHGGG